MLPPARASASAEQRSKPNVGQQQDDAAHQPPLQLHFPRVIAQMDFLLFLLLFFFFFPGSRSADWAGRLGSALGIRVIIALRWFVFFSLI